jgi:hypothetical protein
MVKRLLLALALTASLGGAVIACNTPAATGNPAAPSTVIPSTPTSSDAVSPAASDAMSAAPSAS